MTRLKTLSVTLSLLSGILLQSISKPCFAETLNPQSGRFISEGTDNFNPWTTVDYCEVAKGNADANAAAICSPASALRTSDFKEKFLSVGHGMQCKASAEYTCQ